MDAQAFFDDCLQVGQSPCLGVSDGFGDLGGCYLIEQLGLDPRVGDDMQNDGPNGRRGRVAPGETCSGASVSGSRQRIAQFWWYL